MQISLVVAAACMAMLVADGRAQRLTIPQQIEAARPEVPRWTGRIRELAPRTFEETVVGADLIIRASLQNPRTYLSTDQMELYTDFDMVPTLTISARPRAPRGQPTAQPLVLRQWGGRTRINGVEVEIVDQNLPMLPTNRPLLLLLSLNSQIGKYEIYDDVAGVFDLEDGTRLRHLARPAVAQYGPFNGMDIADAIRHIQELRR